MNFNKKCSDGKKPISSKQLKDFLTKELDIDEPFYHADMHLSFIKGMTEQKYLELLNKIAEHFGRTIEPPPLYKVLFSPTRILNCLNRRGKLYS